MYYLCAEDTSDLSIHKLVALRSIRFSRAMRQARAEPKTRSNCRYFVARLDDIGAVIMSTACTLDVTRKPAPVGSVENQAHQRAVLRKQKPSARSGKTPVQWEDVEV
jgi:hypothetical protein